MGTDLEKYLGDGVYASFDGYQVWLAVNHHNNKVVALDPHVFGELVDYVEWVKSVLEGKNEEGTKND